MKKNNNSLEVPNINSSDAHVKNLIYKIDDLFNSHYKSSPKSEYLCVCSGGTTSSCARNGLITLDLRKEYNQVHLEKEKNLIKIGGGVIMKDLINYFYICFLRIIHKQTWYIIFNVPSSKKHSRYSYYFFNRTIS